MRLLVLSALTSLRTPLLVGSMCLLLGSTTMACSAKRPLVDSPTTKIERSQSEADAPVEMELEEIHIVYREDGTWKRTHHSKYKILSQAGVENWSYTQAYFSPWFEKKPTISAKVINASTSFDVDAKMLSEEPAHPQAPDVYGDARVIRGPLPNVVVGSVIDETVVTESHRPFVHEAYLHRMYFGSNVPTKKARFIIEAPKDMKLQFLVRDAVVNRTEKSAGPNTIVTYETADIPAFEDLEPLLPREAARWPYVAVTSGTSWQPLADTYDKLVEKSLEGIDFKSTVAEIIDRKDSDEEKVRKIHQWVKNRIRYVGVEFGESAVVPYAPDQTISRGFGDCKDQATLLVGLLRAAGFKANVALLLAGSSQTIDPELPALNVFDHAIVHIGGKFDRYLDSTMDLLTADSLPTSDQGHYALVAGASGEPLRRIPAAKSSTNIYSEEREILLAESTDADIVERSRGTGYFDWELRDAFSHGKKDLQKQLEDYVKNAYEAKEVAEIEHGDPQDLLQPFRPKLRAKKTKLGYTWLLGASADLREISLFNWLPESLLGGEEERKNPLHMPMPYQAEIHWKVVAPEGFVPTTLPEKTSLPFGPAELTRTIDKVEGRTVSITSRLDVKKGTFTKKEVAEFREAYKAWGESTVPQVIFEHQSEVLRLEGKIKEAVSGLLKDVSAKKDEARTRMRLAYIVRGYLPEFSRAQADKASELAGNDVGLAENYASYVTENVVGEYLKEGYDRKAALSALEKVYKLDEELLYAPLRATQILESDDKGERYEASREDLNRAITLYDKLPLDKLREFEGGSFVNNVLYTLFWAERYEELATRLSKMSRDDVPSGLAVMNATAMGGAEAGLKEVKRLSLEGEVRSQALEEASAVLVRRRDYPGAIELLEALGTDDQSATRIQSRINMLRAVKKVDLQKLPEGTPAETAVKLMAWAIAKEKDSKSLISRFFAKDSIKSGDETEMEKVLDSLDAKVSRHFSREVLADILVGGSQTKTEGDDKTGYRVKLTFRYGSTKPQSWYMIKEDGRYKIRAEGLPDMGAEALTAFQKKNDKRATQWLDWARERLHVPSGEDTLRIAPFGRLWVDGKGDVEGAAAALAATSTKAEAALAVLGKKFAEAKSDKEKVVYLQAQLQALSHLEKDAQHLKLARKLRALTPKSRISRDILGSALWNNKKYAEYQKEMEQALREAKTESDKADYKQRVTESLERQKQFQKARKLRLELIKDHSHQALNYNELAWLDLFIGAKPEDVKHGLRAVELNRNDSYLHTLACVYADLGQLDEAAKILKELIPYREGNVPAPIDYYIIGRMAEHLGLPAEAKKAYLKIEKPEEVYPTSTYALGQARLRKL